jgi:hypothetical protein
MIISSLIKDKIRTNTVKNSRALPRINRKRKEIHTIKDESLASITFPTVQPEENEENMTPRTKEKYRIRNTPVVNSKYLPVWKRIRTKLKLKKAFG